MPRSERLRLSKQFLAILRRGTWVHTQALSVGTLRNDLPMTRLGLRIRKTVGDAVERNRVKRLLREAYRRAAPSVSPGHDILVVVSRAQRTSLPALERAMQQALSKGGLLRSGQPPGRL